jgi:hypothetical protein
MTVEHAIHYLCNLRDESPSANALSGTWLPGCPPSPTKRQAKKLAKAAHRYYVRMGTWPPSVPGTPEEATPCMSEWLRFMLRIYDESIRLRAIAEGKR